VVAQHAQRAQMHRTTFQQLENHWKTPSQSRRRDPMKSLTFTEPKAPQTVVEKR
jgi:hypothetical protein